MFGVCIVMVVSISRIYFCYAFIVSLCVVFFVLLYILFVVVVNLL